MAMLSEWQVNLTSDRQTGQVLAYVLEDDGQGQWRWLADQAFGPFDTAQDITSWLLRVVSPRMNRLMR